MSVSKQTRRTKIILPDSKDLVSGSLLSSSFPLLLIDLVIWAIRNLASRTRSEGGEVIE
jgi:hypothetical protein